MTYAEAAAVLGPDLTAQVDAQAATAPPLRPEQVRQLAPLLATTGDTDTATPVAA